MEQVSRGQVMREVFRERKLSLVFVVTVITFSLLTFLCEQEIFRSVCGASPHIQVDTYGDRVKIKTSDAGIFVGVKHRIQIVTPPGPLVPVEQTPVTGSDLVEDKDKGEDNNVISDNVSSVSGHDHGHQDVDSQAGTTPATTTSTTTESESGPVETEKVYYVFKGIPYSQPPEGSLRWKEPQVVDIKSSAQDNTKYKSICSQWSRQEKRVVGSQDCLYLNIFTPHIPPPLRRAFLPNPYTVQDIFYQQRHLYPVLIYIHGGDFLSGSGNFYGASKLLQTEDVVLITFNYRLGIFGFLSNGGKEIPGNYGLLDQIQAIKWVHKYIQRFGGNPTRVTIFGDVGYLLLSPLAVGLFQGAVWMSDSWNMFSPPGNKSLLVNPKEFFREIALAANCPVPSVQDEMEEQKEEEEEGGGKKNRKKFEMLECLKVKDVDELVRIQQDILKFDSWPRKFVPVVDAGLRDFPVMMDQVDVLIEMGTLIKVPLIAGVNQIEGYSTLLDFTGRIGLENLRDVDKVKEELKKNLRFVLEEEKEGIVYDKVFEAVWKFYFGESGDVGYGKGIVKKLIGLFGDLKSHAGFSVLSKKLTRNSKPPAFAYVFSHRVNEFNSNFRRDTQRIAGSATRMTGKDRKGSSSTWAQDIPPWQDLHYILESVDSWEDNSSSRGEPLSRVREGETVGTEEEEGQPDMEEIMVKLMTSFANYGTPKQAVAKFENWTRWHRIEPHNVRYYDLTLHPMSMKTSFRSAEANFWYETVPGVREMAKEMEKLEGISETTFWILLAALAFGLLLFVSCFIYCCCLR